MKNFFSKKETKKREEAEENDNEDVFSEEEVPLAKRKGRLPKTMVTMTQEYTSHVVTLRFTVVALLFSLGVAIYTISQMPSQIVIKYAPQLKDGAMTKLGDYPKAAILSDVQYLWLAINTWDEGVGLDGINKILFRYSNFISPEFRSQLENGYRKLSMKGSLDRKRLPHAVPGQMFEFEDRVVKLGDGAWAVYIDIVLEESTEGQTIRKPTYRYAIEVEKYITNLEMNPIGLRLVGFREDPIRIKD